MKNISYPLNCCLICSEVLLLCFFQLMENAGYTFEQLLSKAVQDNPDNAGSAIEKAKHRVLKVSLSFTAQKHKTCRCSNTYTTH